MLTSERMKSFNTIALLINESHNKIGQQLVSRLKYVNEESVPKGRVGEECFSSVPALTTADSWPMFNYG